MMFRVRIENPVCCVCGEVLDIYMFIINGEHYCEYCMEKKFMKDVDEWMQEREEEIYEAR